MAKPDMAELGFEEFEVPDVMECQRQLRNLLQRPAN